MLPIVPKREQIIEAAERVFRAKGLTGATTREIARDAGCADGTLYVHFDDRLALFLALLDRHLPGFLEPLRALEHKVGSGDVNANLQAVLHSALGFQQKMIPIFAALFAEPELLRANRENLRRRDIGPHRSLGAIEDYIRGEQRIGRVRGDADARATAFQLLGACFYRTFVSLFTGELVGPSEDRFVKDVVDSLRLTTNRSPSTRAARRRARTRDSAAKSKSPDATTSPD